MYITVKLGELGLSQLKTQDCINMMPCSAGKLTRIQLGLCNQIDLTRTHTEFTLWL